MTKRILFVCLGNICRSPLAEGIFAHHAASAGLAVKADSAGTSGWHDGKPPHSNSIRAAKARGIDISRQVSRRIQPKDFIEFDLILGMDRSNVDEIARLSRANVGTAEVGLFLQYAGMGARDVPDPWGGPEDGYDAVFDMIDAACPAILRRLKTV